MSEKSTAISSVYAEYFHMSLQTAVAIKVSHLSLESRLNNELAESLPSTAKRGLISKLKGTAIWEDTSNLPKNFGDDHPLHDAFLFRCFDRLNLIMCMRNRK